MIYYHKSRLDCLAKRYKTMNEFTDYFIDHENFLEYRQAIFEKSSLGGKVPRRPIIVSERFHRNPSLNVNDDIQEVIYAIKDNKFIITYHRDNQHITASTRSVIDIIINVIQGLILEHISNRWV